MRSWASYQITPHFSFIFQKKSLIPTLKVVLRVTEKSMSKYFTRCCVLHYTEDDNDYFHSKLLRNFNVTPVLCSKLTYRHVLGGVYSEAVILRPTRQSLPRGTHRFWFGCSTPRCALMMDYIYRILPCLSDSSCCTEPQTAMSHSGKEPVLQIW